MPCAQSRGMTHIGMLLVVGLALRVVGAIPVVFAVLPVPSYTGKDTTCLSASDGCTEAAAASYALDCLADDPTGSIWAGGADDRDRRTIYLPQSVTQAAPLTLEITSCSYMYTTSATAAMDPYQNSGSITISAGATVTVWGVASFNVYRPGCVPPPGDRAPSRAFTHLLEPLLLRRFWLQMGLSAGSLTAALAAALAVPLATATLATTFAAATAVATAVASYQPPRATGAATTSDGSGWRRPPVRGRRWGLLRGAR